MKYPLLPFFLCLSLSVSAFALDQVDTLDGGILTGTISAISANSIILKTNYAGDITIQRDKIKGFSTNQPIVVRLKSGTTLSGSVTHQGDGELIINGTDGSLTTQTMQIAESWSPTQQDPQLARLEQEKEALKRNWSYTAGLDITGRNGNSDEFTTRAVFKAKLASKDDELGVYGSLDIAERNGVDTSDETILGAEYTSYFNEPWGWFVRGEVERDKFEGIELRTLVGSGISYRVLNRDDHSFSVRSGLGYRNEDFDDGNNEQSITLDFGLDHDWRFASWGRMTNKLTYAPAISDFADYLLIHDSGIDIPLGFSELWNIRLGLQNNYKSLPAEGREKLDSNYYTRLQLNW